MNFSGWVLSIVGIVLLSVIVDAVLPDGQTAKYVKSVFAIITVFVIASPLPSLINEGIDFESPAFDDASSQVDDAFLQELFQNRINAAQSEIEARCKASGIDGVEVAIDFEQEELEMKIVQVNVRLKNIVIAEEYENIDIKETVTSAILSVIDISRDRVVFT